MAEKYLLQVKNLKIALKVDKNFFPIVDDVDLSLEPGKVLGLVGESGCGKSVTALSLLRLLSKELKIVDGKILFYGQNGDEAVDIAKLEPKGKDIQRIRGGTVSMIFQEPMSSFSPLHTIGYQIMEVIRLHLNASREKARAIPRARRRPLSGRIFRRHAPACHDRQGALLQSVPFDCRRTHHRPGCHHTGPNPQTHA